MYLEDFQKILADAIATYGEENQKKKCIEECAELIKALCDDMSGRNVIEDVVEEIADVLIMANQMAMIFGNDAVAVALTSKANRLEKRLKDVKRTEE